MGPVWALRIALACSLATTAVAQEYVPPSPMPAELAGYFAQGLRAEGLADPVERCRAYPDLPGNAWPQGSAWARCLRNQAPAVSLEELERMLEAPDGAAAIETRLAQLLDAHFNAPEQRDRIYDFLEQFDDSERAGALATRWLRVSPESPYAMAGLGFHRADAGWRARGTAYSADTSPQQLQRMSQHFAAAFDLLDQALTREPRLGPACVELAKIGRQSLEPLQQMALAHCVVLDPASHYVVGELMTAAKPRWGGSDAALDEVVAHIDRYAAENPALHAYRSDPILDRITRSEYDFGDVFDEYAGGARQAPASFLLEGAGMGTQDMWQRAMWLSQAVRFAPTRASARSRRAEVWLYLNQWDWAAVDLEWLVQHVPEPARHLGELGGVRLHQERHAEAIPLLQAALETPGVARAELLAHQLCFALTLHAPTRGGEQAATCTARLTREQPEDKHGWYMRVWHLFERGDVAGVAEALEGFRRTATPGDPGDAAFVAEFEQALRQVR